MKLNYKATKEFLTKIKNCEFTGKELMEMMETRFKEYKMAGCPHRLNKYNELKEKMGVDRHGNILLGCVLSEIPVHVNGCWRNGFILSDSDKALMSSYHFLEMFKDEIDIIDYQNVQAMFEDFLRTMNEPLIYAA